jgi:hypothetical protein
VSENQFRKYVQSVFPFIEASATSQETIKLSKTKRKKNLANDLLVPGAKACMPLHRRKRAFVDERQLSLFDEIGEASNRESDH